ncbi:MAG: 50S ribosomal protein L10 [archaeon]
MKKESQTHVSMKKVETVKELSELIKNKKTILIASVKNLPSSQFQEIVKKLRGRAVIKLPRKSLMIRAIDKSENEELKKIENYLYESTVILFSDLDSFELASELIDNKSPIKAKAGQEAVEDISIEEGPTDLVPGPAISELGALGIQIQIEKGKINIKEPKVIVKKGENISANAANILSKLDVKPFSVGFVPISAFDMKERKLYSNINIDKKGILEELKKSFGKALAFAVEIGNANSETIKFILLKAKVHEDALSKLIKSEEISEEKSEDKTENIETKDETNEPMKEESQTPEINSGEEK